MPEEQKNEQESTEETNESTEENTEESTESGDESNEESTEESTEEESEESNEDEENEEGEELDLDRAKAKIAKVNDEAKNLRTRLREAEDKLKNAKTPEEVEEIVQQMTKDREDTEFALLRENVALKFKLPEKAIKRLAGKTREELEADAKELADLFGTDEDDDEDFSLEGGLTPRTRESEDPDDPRALAAKYGRRGKRR